MNRTCRRLLLLPLLCLLPVAAVPAGDESDLAGVRARGELRHLGIPYANFNTGDGDGLDVEMMKLFARHLGVTYRYVQTTWAGIVPALTGKRVVPRGQEIEVTGETPVQGDVIANGFTVLPWREKVMAFSTPTFPTQVWLVTPAAAALTPIRPAESLEEDIRSVKAQLKGLTVLGKPGTCLEPSLYGIRDAGGSEKSFPGDMNDLAPALLQGEADALILDVPDCLVALRKWPGRIKVIGPISGRQQMACAFRREDAALRGEYERFLADCKQDGTYLRLVRKYYPDVFTYYPEFFRDCREAPAAVPAAEPRH